MDTYFELGGFSVSSSKWRVKCSSENWSVINAGEDFAAEHMQLYLSNELQADREWALYN